MKLRLLSAALALALMLTSTGAALAHKSNRGGAAGLVAAVVQIAADEVVSVEVVDSFNNLRALNNVLNNSPILSNNDIDVVLTVQDVDIEVLEDILSDNDIEIDLENFLNENDIEIEDVLQIVVLDTGDVLLFI